LPIIPNFPPVSAPILHQYAMVSSTWENGALYRRAREVTENWISMLLAGSVVALGLSGCCGHHRCGGSECCSGAGAADRPVPAAPEYPRFHPVPTRPVFLPDGIEPVPAEVQLRPTDAPALSATPANGWHALRKADVQE
jgi:hypothetical protein